MHPFWWAVCALCGLAFVLCCLVELYKSQKHSETDDIIGFKLTLRTKAFKGSGREYHQYTLYFGSVDVAQDYLNGYNWSHVLCARLHHEASGTSWTAGESGVLLRDPKPVSVRV